jgi:hypothetical protein
MSMHSLFLAFFFVLSAIFPQTDTPETLPLRLTRDFGYGGLNGDIEGRFSMRIGDVDELVEVRFYLDNEVIHVSTGPDFNFTFQTESFPPGPHTLTAIGTLADGRELQGPEFQRNFLTSDEVGGEVQRLIVPLIALVVGLTLITALVPALLGRTKKHVPGQYGVSGGAVCPRCEMPYSRHMLAPNLVTGKLERCPHCGKWAIVPRASVELLQAAETRLKGDGSTPDIAAESEDDKLHRQLDDSRFDN